MDDLFCSVVSQELDEPIYGQAISADVWFLLEYNRPWGAKATAENDLPPQVKVWLDGLATAVPNSRLQFVRQLPDRELTFFVAVVDKTEPRLYRFDVERYADLLEIDVAGVVAGDAAFAAYRWTSPLFLVCTNGKRDRCCAKFGAAVYRELQTLVGRAVWQTTHLGGHRFAPNVMTFPDGILYSRLTANHEALADFVALVRGGTVSLPHYRGRTCYGEVEQAADYFLRQETGLLGVADLRHVASWTVDDGPKTRVQFVDKTGGLHEVTVGVETAVPEGILASCGKPQTKPVAQYSLISIQNS